MSDNTLNIRDLATSANEIFSNTDFEEIYTMDLAIKKWMEASERISQIRPNWKGTKNFLHTVCAEVIVEIKEKYEIVFVVTMSTVVKDLVNVLIVKYDLQNLTQYKIPIQLLAAVIFSKLLETAYKKVNIQEDEE